MWTGHQSERQGKQDSGQCDCPQPHRVRVQPGGSARRGHSLQRQSLQPRRDHRTRQSGLSGAWRTFMYFGPDVLQALRLFRPARITSIEGTTVTGGNGIDTSLALRANAPIASSTSIWTSRTIGGMPWPYGQHSGRRQRQVHLYPGIIRWRQPGHSYQQHHPIG